MGSVLRVPLSPLVEGRVVLPDAAGRYVSRVHRLSAGDAFLAFDPEARTEADVVIATVDRRVTCDVGVVRPARAVARSSVTLLQGMGKGDKPDQIIRDATALGASRVVFFFSSRSVPRLSEREEAKRVRYRTIAVEAARQCGRGDLPAIEGPLPLDDALRVADSGLRVCLSPAAAASFAGVLASWGAVTPLSVLVGPEGGLTEEELRHASELGFVMASFGDFVLRTETAAVAVLGAVVARASEQ